MNTARISSRATLLTWGALVLLAVASFLLSSFHLGRAGSVVAIVIAAAKAALVAMVFMELSVQRASNRIVLVTAIGFVVLLASLAVVDVATRAGEPAAPPVPTAAGEWQTPERGAARPR